MISNSYPLISIVVPSFNQGAFVEDTLCSILNQDYPNLEVIVMDGGSTDETLSILERYQDQISYFSEPDRGQSHAINKALDCVKGDIIGWLNSDDLYPDRKTLWNMFEAFERMPDADILYGDFIEIDAYNRVVKYWQRPNFSFTRLLRVGYISQPSTFMRRRVIDKLRIREDLHYAMDTEFWLRASSKGLIIRHVPFLVAAERLHRMAKNLNQTENVADEAIIVRVSYGAIINTQWRVLKFLDKVFLYIVRLPAILSIHTYMQNTARLTIKLDFTGSIQRTLALGVRNIKTDSGEIQ